MDKIKTKNGELKKYKGKNYNQLMIIDNTEKNHQLIKELNKEMSKFGSRWRISKKARMPKDNKKWGWGGSLSFEDAKGIGIYIYGTKSWNDECYKRRRELLDWKDNHHREQLEEKNNKISDLRNENEILKSELDKYKLTEEIDYLRRLSTLDFDVDSYGVEILNRVEDRLRRLEK